MADLYYPLDPALVTEWPGPRDGGSWWHYGTDFGVPVDTALRACFDGEIVFAGGDGAAGVMNGVRANGEGLTVDIRRDDGLIARYGHMNRIDVRVGQRVKAGGYIGLSGNTGYTLGPHCHWELRWDRAWSGGAWVDPRPLKPGRLRSPATSKKEDAVKAFHYEHREVRPIAPKQRLYLCDTRGKKRDLVAAAGPTVLSAHVYGEKFAPGDVIEIRYEVVRDGKSSPHYLDRVIADKYGLIQATRTFQRSVAADDVVNLSVYASQGNKGGLARITLLDSDAYTFAAA
ncbi:MULTISPECIES: M23 family metallopeptidase [unclassified Leucobacter]|uniref:M23 family metallopeptidase n=1 Tax=unclassified Leucobacter TaxID=2621730 RepID=UPI00069A9371|nr:M23 family metallopeptidase [Leucobacter sp. Ag1]